MKNEVYIERPPLQALARDILSREKVAHMEIEYPHDIFRYTLRRLERHERTGGCDGMKLFRSRDEPEEIPQLDLVATVIYWDAVGEWAIEVFNNSEIPLTVLERLIEESKNAVFPDGSSP